MEITPLIIIQIHVCVCKHMQKRRKTLHFFLYKSFLTHTDGKKITMVIIVVIKRFYYLWIYDRRRRRQRQYATFFYDCL